MPLLPGAIDEAISRKPKGHDPSHGRAAACIEPLLRMLVTLIFMCLYYSHGNHSVAMDMGC